MNEQPTNAEAFNPSEALDDLRSNLRSIVADMGGLVALASELNEENLAPLQPGEMLATVNSIQVEAQRVEQLAANLRIVLNGATVLLAQKHQLETLTNFMSDSDGKCDSPVCPIHGATNRKKASVKNDPTLS